MNYRYVTLLIIIFLSLLIGLHCQPQSAIELSDAKGHLLIIGGGSRPDTMMQRFAELAAQHSTGKIVIIPNASATPLTTGPSTVSALQELCMNEVTWFNITPENVNEDTTQQFFNGVGGIYFSGGVQTRLTSLLLGTRLLETIKQIYQEGGTLAGTSAGAAIMSDIMITGDKLRHEDERSDQYNYRYIEGGYIATTPGFGFLPGTIIDQHFVKRERLTRLINLVIENPDHIGIGIDESTAIIHYPDNTLEVIGRSSVLLFDATSAIVAPYDSSVSHLLSAANINFHVLKEGQQFDLKTLSFL